jgi:hypothetical protein
LISTLLKIKAIKSFQNKQIKIESRLSYSMSRLFFITNFSLPIACANASAVVKFYIKRGRILIVFSTNSVYAAAQLWSNLVIR